MGHSSQAHSSKAPISKCKFSKLISIHFLEELVNRICSYIKVFSHQVIILLILTTFSLDYILIFREKIDFGHSWDLRVKGAMSRGYCCFGSIVC